MIEPSVTNMRVGVYCRVSSEEQRRNETIKTQQDAIGTYLATSPTLRVADWYMDDGISGALALETRPAGKRLMRDAMAGRLDAVLVQRFDRLGRDDVDPLLVWRELEKLNIRVLSATQGWADPFMYSIHVAVAAQERRTFLERSAAGMNRAAKEGRYTGGIVPYGYTVVGEKPHARLAASDLVVCGTMTEAGVVRLMYRRLAIDGWSCHKVAQELNALGVPTHYKRDGRGVRGQRTKGLWTAGRVRNTITQPVYRGERLYGRRTKRQREVISSACEPLVSDELWHAAQETLRNNRVIAKNTTRIYLLRRVLRCHHCGRHYSGSWNPRDGVRYLCNGAALYKLLQAEKCPARSLRGRELEELIWRDVERWLRDPGDVLDELQAERDCPGPEAVWEAERATLEAALAQKRMEKDRLLDAYQDGAVPLGDLKPRMDAVDDQVRALDQRIADLDSQAPDEDEAIDDDLLAELRRRVDEDLDDRERQEIVSLLVSAEMITEVGEDGKKRLTAFVTYRFPRVVNACTGTGSSSSPS